MTCGFVKPHSPPTAPKKWFDSLPLNTIPLPVDFKPETDPTPEFPAASLPPSGDLFIGRKASEAAAKEMIQAYQASVKWVDWNAGRVLDALTDAPLDAILTISGMATPNFVLTDPAVGDYHRVISPGT